MREIRTHGLEGGGTETNRSFLPLSPALKAEASFRTPKGAGLLHDPPRREAEHHEIDRYLSESVGVPIALEVMARSHKRSLQRRRRREKWMV